MCEPVSMAIVAGATIVGTGYSMYAANQQGKAAAAQARMNQAIADEAAVDALRRGRTEAAMTRMEGSRVIGTQVTQLAKSGFDLQSADSLSLLSDTAFMSEYDAKVIENNAAREAWGFKVAGVQAQAQGRLDVMRAKQSQVASLLGGVSQLGSAIARGAGAPAGGAPTSGGGMSVGVLV